MLKECALQCRTRVGASSGIRCAMALNAAPMLLNEPTSALVPELMGERRQTKLIAQY